VDPSHGDQRGEVDIKMVMATALRPAIIHLESASVQDHRGHPMMMAQATDDFADDPHDALVPAGVDDVALRPSITVETSCTTTSRSRRRASSAVVIARHADGHSSSTAAFDWPATSKTCFAWASSSDQPALHKPHAGTVMRWTREVAFDAG
jgi:hypothetical protein